MRGTQEAAIPAHVIEMHEELKRLMAREPTAEERIADLEERVKTLERVVLALPREVTVPILCLPCAALQQPAVRDVTTSSALRRHPWAEARSRNSISPLMETFHG